MQKIYFGSHEFPYSPIRGTFRLRLGTQETAILQHDATPAQIREELEAFVGAGNVTVAALNPSDGHGYELTFASCQPPLEVFAAESIRRNAVAVMAPSPPVSPPEQPEDPQYLTIALDDPEIDSGEYILSDGDTPVLTITAGTVGSDVALLLSTAGYPHDCYFGCDSAVSYTLTSVGPAQRAWSISDNGYFPLGRPGSMSVEA